MQCAKNINITTSENLIQALNWAQHSLSAALGIEMLDFLTSDTVK
jgi:hypothetical protein